MWSTHSGELTSVSIQEGCGPHNCNLQSKLCFPLYTVVQAIINLANPCGSTEYEILSQAPIICSALSVGPTQVAQALAEGVRKRVLCSKTQSNQEVRYFVNVNMNKFLENQEIYDCFKAQIFCSGPNCTPCSSCTYAPPPCH